MAPGPKNDPARRGWVADKTGYEFTRSTEVISNTIAWIIEKNSPITLLHKGYQSGKAGFMLEKSARHILIDKPEDWPHSRTNIKVIFRNAANLTCYFTCNVTAAQEETISLSLPDTLYMLQRRAHFRVDLPMNSTATFMYKKKKCKLNIKDLSAGGMLICDTDNPEIPAKGQLINNISISIPAFAANEENAHLLTIHQGIVVRSSIIPQSRLSQVAIQFSVEGTQEEKIMQFIRRRELALLRKGIQD